MNVGVSVQISFKHSLGGNLKKNVLIAGPNVPSGEAQPLRRHRAVRRPRATPPAPPSPEHCVHTPSANRLGLAAAARLALGGLGAIRRRLPRSGGLVVLFTLAQDSDGFVDLFNQSGLRLEQVQQLTVVHLQ